MRFNRPSESMLIMLIMLILFGYLSMVLTGGCVFVEQTNFPSIPLDILPESPVVARVDRRKSQKNLDNKNEKKIGQKIKMTFGLGVCCV